MRAFLALFAAAGFAILSGGPASDQPRPVDQSARAQADEWSGARKRRYVRTYRKPAYAYRAPVYGRPNDPSFGPDGRPYRRPYDPGGCIYDEGYGRFSACPNR